jgi:alkylation response protein AidB-like acyl-CoA dehydrogenase
MIEISELRDAAQKAFPADKLAPSRDENWQLVAEMGWLMLRLPEELGGLGLDREASTAIHFEMGRVLSTVPLLPAMLTIEAIAMSTTLADKEQWAERLCAGEYVPLHVLPAQISEADGALSGTISGVLEADMATHVLAGLPGRYLLIPLDADGVSIGERPLWDETRRMFDVQLDGYRPDPALTVADSDGAKAMHDAISPEAQVAIAADCLGAANAALDATVEYLTMRKQFDRPLAMFQALKHRCSDMKIAIFAAESLLWESARSGDATTVDLGAMKALAAETFQFVTEEMIQLHGGIGLTEEHNSHLFMKRAMLNLQLCGSVDHWKEQAGRQALARCAA